MDDQPTDNNDKSHKASDDQDNENTSQNQKNDNPSNQDESLDNAQDANEQDQELVDDNEPEPEYKNVSEAEEVDTANIGKKRKRQNEINLDKIHEDTLWFIERLKECIASDNANKANKKPALAKFKFVPSIKKFLANCYYQQDFLSSNGWDYWKEWIKRNSDGTYPPWNQIDQILDCLFNMNYISTNHWQESQFGGFVLEISKKMKISPSLMSKANKLVEKWMRIVCNVNSNYGDIESENTKYKEVFWSDAYKKEKEDYSEEGDSSDSEDKEKKNQEKERLKKEHQKALELDMHKEKEWYSNAKIPKRGLFDFVKKPISNVTADSSRFDESRMNINMVTDIKKKKRTGKKETKDYD